MTLQADAEGTSSEAENGISSSGTNKDDNKPRISYRQEFINRFTGDTLFSEEIESLTAPVGEKLSPADERKPIFEIVRTFRIRDFNTTRSSNKDENMEKFAKTAASYLKPVTTMHLVSHALCHALRSVVRYYPDQDLAGDTIEIAWPYPILVHHYDELREYRNRCEATVEADLCEREVDAVQDIDLLLKYLDDTVMDDVNAEIARNKVGKTTWEHAWVKYRPGKICIVKMIDGTGHRTVVIHSVSGGAFSETGSNYWRVKHWQYEYGNECLIRTSDAFEEHRFDGEANRSETMIDMDGEVTDELAKPFIEAGRSFWNLINPQCRNCKGKTKRFPFIEVCLRIPRL
jgi:hypothetical protein